MIAALTAALRPRGPYPIWAIQGEQGSGKSTTTRVARMTTDPHVSPLRWEPREVCDLMIAATSAWCVTLDNLSTLPPWLSDGLCRLATSGGFGARTLYENDEETFFDAMRPVLLNGIEEVAARFDLVDRCLIFQLPAIPEERRKEEGPFWRDFKAAHPRILSALLDAVAGGLHESPGYTKNRKKAVVPLRRDLCEPLRGYRSSQSAESRVWPGSSVNRSSEMLRADLALAGIACGDEAAVSVTSTRSGNGSGQNWHSPTSRPRWPSP